MSTFTKSSAQRPVPLRPNYAGIHPDLKALDQWVMWRYLFKAGKTPDKDKWTKVPYQPNGRSASSTDTATWSSFSSCAAAYDHPTAGRRFDGIGFVASATDDFVLIDLDHIKNPDCPMEPWARELLDTALSEGAYVETSVGGDGAHAIVRGPQGFLGTKVGPVEVYCEDRYFTITGHSESLPETIGLGTKTVTLALELTGFTLEQRVAAKQAKESGETREVEQIITSGAESMAAVQRDSLLPANDSCASGELAPVSDSEIIRRAKGASNGAKFTKLYDSGDLSDHHEDASRADLALASMLAFWAGPDPARIDRLMRTSALAREKWGQHKTYLSMTINKALAEMAKRDFYDWGRYGMVGTLSSPAMQALIAPSSGHQSPTGGTSGGQTLTFVTDRRGLVTPCVTNVLLILTNDPDLIGLIRYDEFADRLDITAPIPDRLGPPDTRQYPRRWLDADTVDLVSYVQRHFIPKTSRSDVQDALVAHQPNCAYHPVREYLNGLKWDGVSRLDTWLIEYANADTACGAAYLEQIGAKFLISAVARIFSPGCQADHVIVLEGEQGVGKSSALAALAGDEWFSDCLPSDLSHKDTAAHLKGKWLIEMSELAQFQRSNIETVKAYITRRTDKYRPPYGRQEIEVPRQCVFTGSTNSDSYLVDATGNRRFWPVKVNNIDVVALRRDRDQLWGEALSRFRAGESWHLTDDEIAVVQAQEVARRTVGDPWEAQVAEILDKSVGDKGLTPGEVLDRIYDLKPSEKHKGNAARVSQIMRDHGWHKGKRIAKRGQVYHRSTK